MQETLNSKKQGDAAFRAKDFSTAIDCYTQVIKQWFLSASCLSTKRHSFLDFSLLMEGRWCRLLCMVDDACVI